MLVNFAFPSFPGRALAERRASVLASPLHALQESLRSPPGRAGAPMGAERGAGGSAVWPGVKPRRAWLFGCSGGGGRGGCAAGRPGPPTPAVQHRPPARPPGPGLSARAGLCAGTQLPSCPPPASRSAGRPGPETKANKRRVRGESSSALDAGPRLCLPALPPLLLLFGAVAREQWAAGSRLRPLSRSQRRPQLREPVPSRRPAPPFVPAGPGRGAAGAGGAARGALRAPHLGPALSGPLSNQGPAAAVLTKAEARVPLSSLCRDPRPGAVGVAPEAGSCARSGFTLGLAGG
ncbi:uncharacterized protein VSU04_010107 [Chlamydotis macqueenii]